MRVKHGRLEGATGNLVPFKAKKFPLGNPKLSGSKPRFLVIHYTAGGSASGAINTFQSAKASAHLVIGHNGDITQMAKFDEVCWHAGESRWKNIKGLNSHSIGIEIVNWGKLRKTASGDFVTWTGSKVSADRVIEEEHKHFPGTKWGWEIFDPAQMEATLEAARAIVEEYDISPWDLVGHDDISPLRKVDPGPAFDMDSFRASVFGRPEDDWDDLIFKVNSNTGLNMRTEASVGGKLIKNLPDNTKVHVIEKTGKWWLVAEVISNDDDVTGYVHSHWLQPSS